ncbi:MAG: methyltransferase domain-containing protein [Acidobacteriota bacterium]
MQGIIEKIQDRYSAESKGECSTLSCGSNLDYLNLQPGEWVLDLGCGAGRETLEAAKRVGKQGVVVGLDITSEMLKVAESNARDSQLSNARFITASIEQLPFADSSFNVVISNCVINHALDKSKVYREIHRVLKAGGKFVVSDAVCKQPLPDEIKNDPEQWAACFGGAITEEEYLKSISDAGFYKVFILNRREYMKNGYEFASLTIRADKN